MRRLPALPIVLACVFVLSACGPRNSSTPVASDGSGKPLLAEAPAISQTAGPNAAGTGRPAATATSLPPASHTVEDGDVLSNIAKHYGVSVADLVEANHLADPDDLHVGQELIIPVRAASTEATPRPPAATKTPGKKATSTAQKAPAAEPTSEDGRASVFDRLSVAAQMAPEDSPYHNQTWVTYYGRPEVPLLGILGEYNLDELVPRLREQADAYDEANGPRLGVMPAFHLIYGMATAFTDDDGSFLSYMTNSETKAYIDRANQENFGVILDVQIGALTPVASLEPAFKWLKEGNVNLAIDPEFAMSDGQTVPGQPAGTVTADQINAIQAAMSSYMEENGIGGYRILVVHQFLPWMIDNKDEIYRYKGVELTVCADGFGDPPTKVSKYNDFIHENVPYAGYKLFYGYDEPLMSERQTLGIDDNVGAGYMEVTPNFIIYQ